VFSNMFGSFRKALEKYGIEHSALRTGRDPLTLDDTITHFEKVWEKHEPENRGRIRPLPLSGGNLALYNRLNSYSGPSKTYRRYWGSFPQFVGAFAAFKRGEMRRSRSSGQVPGRIS